jgi:hypothetical protein
MLTTKAMRHRFDAPDPIGFRVGIGTRVVGMKVATATLLCLVAARRRGVGPQIVAKGRIARADGSSTTASSMDARAVT